MTGLITGRFYHLRRAKTYGGNEVRILIDEPDYIIGVYWSEDKKCFGWIPVRWSKLNPFVNGIKTSGLDLLEDIKV